MPQLMQQDNGAVLQVFGDVGDDLLRTVFQLPIHRCHLPHHERNTQFLGRPDGVFVELAERGAKKSDLRAGNGFDCLDAALDFLILLFVTELAQIQVLNRMGAD